MKIKGIKNSLVKTCIFHFVIYSLAAVLLVAAMNSIISTVLNNAFSNFDVLLTYSEQLKHDDFSGIPRRKLKDVQFAVFDEKGTQIYSLGEDLQVYLSKLDAGLIPHYGQDSFFETHKYRDAQGRLCYAVMKLTYDEQIEDYTIQKYAVIDDEYRILAGDLLEDRDRLSEEDFLFIRGDYGNTREVYQYQYETADGTPRLLVYMNPEFTVNEYEKVVRYTNKLWAGLIPILLFMIVLQSFLFSRKIKKSIAPLDNAIVQYGTGQKTSPPAEEIPVEFSHVMEHFALLSSRLDRAREEKEHEENERYRYIANITHDLNTPLTAILGYSKAFCDGMVVPEKEKFYMEAIYRKAKVCSDLMNTFFEYTKLEHPDYSLQRRSVDLAEFLREYLSEKYTDIQIHDFILEPDIPEKPIIASVDQTMMERALDNLIQNSLKYNPKGTTIFCSLRETDGAVRLIVADNGVGIPEDISKELFSPFVTGNAARTPGGGTGFGMAITKKIIELHGGTIRLVQPPESGCSMETEIILPGGAQ